MRDALRGVGFGWVVAESGKRALEILRSCPEWYDLVLVHLRLPCISGGTLIRQIVKEMPGLYIVAQAGDWSAGEIRDAYEAGAQVLLRKGQDPRNIADTLVRSLNLVREHRSAAQRRLAHEQKRAKAPWYQQVGHWGRRLVLAPSGSATKGRLTLAAIGTAFLLLGIFVGWLIQGGLTETDVVRARAARFLDAFERMGGKEPSDRKFEHWYQGQRLDLERNRTEEVHRSHAEEMESRRIDSNLKDAEEGSRPLPKTQDRHNR